MEDNNDRPTDQYLNHIRIGHLPSDVTAKEITTMFDIYGTIRNLFLKRRVSKDSDTFLRHPYVILIFDQPESVDHIMATRPFFMGDCRLFVRRCMPLNGKYPHEAFYTVNKILIHTASEKNDEVLPDDNSIVDYLSFVGGRIEYFERLDDKNVLIQFDDYDPVDICCLSRPHFIKNQLVEIEKCTDEGHIRDFIKQQQEKLNFVSDKLALTSTTTDINNQTMDTVPSTPILSIDDQITQLRSSYNDIADRLEREHEQLVASLSNEWEQTAKERIRLQRLKLDYQHECERLTKENRQWQKLFSDSLREKPNVQQEGEQKLREICQKYEKGKAEYDQLIQNIR